MQEKNHHKKIAIGVAIGFAFPIVSIAISLTKTKLPMSFTSILNLYSDQPVHWILLTTPVVFGVIIFLLVRSADKREALLISEKEKSEKVMTNIADFLKVIEAGNFDTNSKDLGDDRLNQLFSSLVSKLADQKENDSKTNWITTGQAKFGEILRSTNDLRKLSDLVIREIVKYVGLNQGGVYIHDKAESNDSVLTLTACYAYDRKKYVSGSIEPGQGLVGQCYLEQDTIILKDVPKDYVRITSGLGEATPTFIVLVPLKANDHTEGVIELASFHPLENYQIKFLQSIGEAFASVIRSVKTADHTRQLLEETQHQTQQLRLQEEEIRQNMEEMQATQEQLVRQLTESKILRDRVERREQVMALTTILSETDLHGTITYVNDKFCEIAKYEREELIGKPHNMVRHPDMPPELFRLFWATIKRGDVFRGIVKNRARDGSCYWVDATIVPMKDEHGKVIKYVGSRYHIVDDDMGTALYNQQAAFFGWPQLSANLVEETH